jgi:hypothetical protein
LSGNGAFALPRYSDKDIHYAVTSIDYNNQESEPEFIQ